MSRCCIPCNKTSFRFVQIVKYEILETNKFSKFVLFSTKCNSVIVLKCTFVLTLDQIDPMLYDMVNNFKMFRYYQRLKTKKK